MPNLVDEINQILGIDESYKATDRMWQIIYDRSLRESKMRELLELFKGDVSFDWFREYYEEEQAERKSKKQDFTPQELTELLNRLGGNANRSYDVCCGTGGITITKWNMDRLKHSPFEYRPSQYLYFCDDLSDKTIPFLLFNLAVRGANAIVRQVDVLTLNCKGVWFVFNERDDILGFSTINLFPYSEKVEQVFGVKFIEKKYKKLIESEVSEYDHI